TWPPEVGSAAAWRDRVAPLVARLTLRDGRCVRVRPVHAADAPAAQAFVEALSPQSRRRRFHGALKHLPPAALRALTAVDQRQHVAIVAEAGCADGAARLVAEARYVRAGDAHAPSEADSDDAHGDGVDDDLAGGEAEFAIVVADDWQGVGLAAALMQRLGRHARAQGIGVLRGSVLADNGPMLALMRRLGAVLHGDPFDASVVHARVPL
ncbi:MAG: GNAT family N-acetyltransferase, partial [Rubrivivax sp.]|nr:GNAT family N-acetyltransferase [Rubrivivax sp.]